MCCNPFRKHITTGVRNKEEWTDNFRKAEKMTNIPTSLDELTRRQTPPLGKEGAVRKNQFFCTPSMAAKMTLQISGGRSKAVSCLRSISTHGGGAIVGCGGRPNHVDATEDLP